MEVQYFRALRQNNRFNKNQKVFIRHTHDYHFVYFKWRGKGRYVTGRVDRFSSIVGEIKTIDVAESFALRVLGGKPEKTLW